MGCTASSDSRVVRFGAFELDLNSGELRRDGVRTALQDQPLQLLRLLLERPGALITRETLRQALWPGDTFVDFEHGLNAATKRLRDTLGDSVDTPRFIETVPRRGYRFIASVEGARRPSRLRGLSVVRATVLAAIAVAAITATWALKSPRVSGRQTAGDGAGPLTHSVIELPADAQLSLGSGAPVVGFNGPLVAISPDGTQIVYVGGSGGETKLFLRPTSGDHTMPIPGTQGAIHPFFSPDGHWLGFLTNDKVKKVSLAGGTPITLCEIRVPVRATWTRAGLIYVSAIEGRRLFRLRADGGPAEEIERTNLMPNALTFDQVMPDGRAALASTWGRSISRDYGDIVLMSLESRDTKVLIRSGYDARYIEPGYLLFARSGNLLAVRFDAAGGKVLDEPILVASGAAMESLWGQAQVAASANGLLVYVSGGDRSVGRLADLEPARR